MHIKLLIPASTSQLVYHADFAMFVLVVAILRCSLTISVLDAAQECSLSLRSDASDEVVLAPNDSFSSGIAAIMVLSCDLVHADVERINLHAVKLQHARLPYVKPHISLIRSL